MNELSLKISSTLRFLSALLKKILSINIRYVLYATLLILIGFGVFRACSGGKEIDHVYKIASDPNWYPLRLYEKERAMTAFMNELLMTISQKEKIDIELMLSSPTHLLEGLQTREYDGILSIMSPEVTTREHYDFSDPLFVLGTALVVRKNSTVESLEDLKGRIVAIQVGEISSDFPKKTDIVLTSYDNILSALLDLDRGKVDGVIMETLQANVYLSGLFTGKLRLIPFPMSQLAIRLVMRRDVEHESVMLKHFNAGLKALKEDGSYDALMKKWSLNK